MAPENVRTIPPWIIQRPPQSLLPQHNHAPSDPRHASGVSNSSRDEVDYDTNDDEVVAHAVDADGEAAPADASRTADTVTTTTDESPHMDLGRRISLLFRRKEGRRWDHLRSAEPVIVPQYHVTNAPAAHARAHDSMSERRLSIPEEGYHEEGDGMVHESGEGVAGPPRADGAPAREPMTTAAALSTGRSAAYASFARASYHNSHASRKRPTYSAAADRHPWWYNPGTQWRGFIESSRYPHLPNEKSEIVDDEEMARLHPHFGFNPALRPKAGGGDGGGGVGHIHHDHRREYLSDKAFYKRIWNTALHHPLGPLTCRLIVLSTSIMALALAAAIFRREQLGSLGSFSDLVNASSNTNVTDLWMTERQQERTQIIVAIVVDIVAVPYIGYITVDDYTGKPLGLRRPQSRIRLILTDLFFVIFKSASTALGFEAMIFFNTEDSQGLLRALGAFELIGLISWALTLTINIFREVERLGG